jgi:hypothetical protein
MLSTKRERMPGGRGMSGRVVNVCLHVEKILVARP